MGKSATLIGNEAVGVALRRKNELQERACSPLVDPPTNQAEVLFTVTDWTLIGWLDFRPL